MPYSLGETHDILPASDSGTSFANGMLVESTLVPAPSPEPPFRHRSVWTVARARPTRLSRESNPSLARATSTLPMAAARLLAP